MLLLCGQVSVIINSNCQVTQDVVRIATSIMAVGQSQPLSYLPGITILEVSCVIMS